jgi:hypothetical protein
MSRSIDAGLLAALTASECSPYYAVEIAFDTATTRLWTGIGDRTVEGNTYLGVGHLIAIDGLEESSDLSAKGATLTLSGLQSGIMSLALTEPYQGRRVRILFGEVSVTPVIEVFSGIADRMPISQSPESVTIQLTVESKMVQLQKAKVRRMTSENHKLRHPGDTFFDWTTQLADMEIAWGREID